MTSVAIIGNGPAGITAAIALARLGIHSTVIERDASPEQMPRFNPDRSYMIDITGHGLRAIRHIDAVADFDANMTAFNGIKYRGRRLDKWDEPGWIGSRGDIMRTLMKVAEQRYPNEITFEFNTPLETLDVSTGAVNGQRFDIVLGADGAGSAVRDSLKQQAPGFTTTPSHMTNYAMMLELDEVNGRLDKHCLNILGASPIVLAGSITDHEMPDGVRWLCLIGLNAPLSFESPDDAKTWLKRFAPTALPLLSDSAIDRFANRDSQYLGRGLTCSTFHAGKVVLLGDAANPFPPIGQGINAAMESATVLADAMEHGPLHTVGARYEQVWRPEAEALTGISRQILFHNPVALVRLGLSAALGANIIGGPKSSTGSYAQVWRRARRLRPITR